MDRRAKIEGLIQRAAFDADGRPVDALPVVPNTAAAVGAEHQTQAAAAVRHSHPALRRTAGETEILAPDDRRNAEGRGGLLPAFAAMT
jgi:hypothetical protein